jgi:hypothetical protein
MGTSSLLDIRDVYTQWHGVEHFATDLGSSFPSGDLESS